MVYTVHNGLTFERRVRVPEIIERKAICSRNLKSKARTIFIGWIVSAVKKKMQNFGRQPPT